MRPKPLLDDARIVRRDGLYHAVDLDGQVAGRIAADGHTVDGAVSAREAAVRRVVLAAAKVHGGGVGGTAGVDVGHVGIGDGIEDLQAKGHEDVQRHNMPLSARSFSWEALLQMGLRPEYTATSHNCKIFNM